MHVHRWSKLPDIIAALFVHAVVSEMHERVLNVLWSPVILDCGKSVDRRWLFVQVKKKKKKKTLLAIQQLHCISICHNDNIHAADTWLNDTGNRERDYFLAAFERSGCHMCNNKNSLAHTVPEYQHNPKECQEIKVGFWIFPWFIARSW